METARDDLWPPRASANGYALTREFPKINSDDDAARRQRQSSANQETTRYLAAATQLDPKYAASVVRRIFGEPLKALTPGYGIDVAVVAMWAVKALRTQATRDLILAAVLSLHVLSIALAIMTSTWFLVALPPLFVIAWLAVSWEYWERIHRCVIGQLLRDRFDPAQAPLPKRADERERLQELAERKDGNLVVFSGPSAFVGTGSTEYSRRILFDISFGSDPEKEEFNRKKNDFTSHDIHAAVVDAFSNSHGLGKSLQNIAVHERLFVNGRHVQADNRLLPDPLKPPRTTVDVQLLAAVTGNPSNDARTYVCVEIPGWQGQLVVTLFARAVYTGKSLFVEWTFQVLPPLRSAFLRIDTYFEYPPHIQALDSLSRGLRATTSTLLCSPATALRPLVQLRRARRQRRRLSYAITHGYVFDYGAVRGIREDASGKDSRHFFLARDERMYMLLAQQTLLQAVRTFLSDHGVELEKFDQQVQYIFDHSIHIGDIKDSTGVAVGNKSAANVGSSQDGKNNNAQEK